MGNVKNMLPVFILLSSILLSSAAQADTGTKVDTGTAWDLDNLQAQRVLYEAKAAVNKAKAEAEGQGVSTGTPFLAPNSTNQGVSGQVVGDGLPQLVKINGRNAVISMPGGNSTTVSAGQMLPGGRWQVLSVELEGVKIKNIGNQKIQVLN